MTLSLDKTIQTDQTWDPQRILLYSVQGLGKNTFASTFENPFLLSFEDGSGNTKMSTFMEGNKPKVLTDFSQVVEAINALHGEHDYKTLVIDTLDWLEPIVWAKQIKECPLSEKGKEVKSIEDYGWGKGYLMALDWWRWLMGGFNSLRFRKGMTIVLLAHCEIKRYDSPETEPYDRYQIKLNKHAFALWQEWADMVLFANYKTKIEKTDVGFNKEVKRGKGSGERMLYTEERPAFLAKNRWGLEPEIYIGTDKTWSAFHQELSVATGGRYKIPTNQTKEIVND